MGQPPGSAGPRHCGTDTPRCVDKCRQGLRESAYHIASIGVIHPTLRFWMDELLSGHLIHYAVWAALYAVAGGASTRVRRSVFTPGSIDATSHHAYTGCTEIPDALGISISAYCA